MNKSKFEKMKPKVEKAMLISKENEDKLSEEIISGWQTDLEERMPEDPSSPELRNYLMGLDYEELKIIQSFMLTGREVENELYRFDNEDIEDMFVSYSDKPNHINKTAIVGYMADKSPFGEYIYHGLEAYKQINE